MYEEDFNDAQEDYYLEEYKPDEYFLRAKEEIRSLYKSDIEKVYYIRQLQVRFEKTFFHWITYNAIESLKKEGYLKPIPIGISEVGTPIQFLVHHKNRYPKRIINESVKIIKAYSNENITSSCGHMAENLFAVALARRGFLPVVKKARKYKDKIWKKTDHDLDYIFEEQGIAYGAEIKNTLGYIEKKELETKIDMCFELGLRPFFILRYAPKTYIEMVREAGGYTMLFETQIYELSQQPLVEEIKNKLGLPVLCSASIPDGIIDRFFKWHKKHLKP